MDVEPDGVLSVAVCPHERPQRRPGGTAALKQSQLAFFNKWEVSEGS